MPKYLNILIKTGIMLTIIPFIIITYNALLNTDVGFFLSNFSKRPTYIFWFVTILIFLFVIVIWKLINKWDDKKKRILKYIMISILLIIQFILILDIYPIFNADSYIVLDQGEAIANGIDKIVDYESTFYWEIYSNNNFFLLIIILFYKFLNLIHLSSYSNFIIILNALLIDMAVYFTYKVAKKLKGNDFALKVLVLCIINPFNYFFIFWPYTNTFSWPFVILIIYLTLLLKECKTVNLKFVIYSIIFGIVALIGYMLRPTMIISLIAIFITYIIYIILNKKKVKKYFSKNWKKLIATAILVLATLGFGYKITSDSIKTFYPDNSKNFPIAHWLMIGSSEDGLLDNGQMNKYTYSFDTKQKMIDGDIKKIKEQIFSYGLAGSFRHFAIKMSNNFADDYDYQTINLKKHSKFFKYIYGEKTDFVNIYSNAFRNFLYLLVLISLFSQLKAKKIDYRILFTITLFGVILFYSIWEVKNVYHLPYVSIMILLAASSLELATNKISNLTFKQKKKCRNIGLIAVLFTIITFASFYQSYTKPLNVYHDYQIKADINQYINWQQNLASNGYTLKQEFYAKGKFNNISLLIFKIYDNDTIYDIKLYDGKKVIAKKSLTSKDIQLNSNKGYINFSFKTQNPDKKHKYFITISSREKSYDSINWGYILTRLNGKYSGDLFIDNQLMGSDLAMVVSYEYYGAYVSKTQYIALMIFVIFLELLIIKNLFYQKKSKN